MVEHLTPSPPSVELSARGEFRQYWRVLLAALLGTAFGSLAGYTFGVFAEPLSHAFGVSLASVGAWNTFWVATTIIAAPLVGRMADRYGARRIALWFNPLLAFSLASCSLAGSIGALYIGAMLIGASSPGASSMIYGRVVNNWFKQGRGAALGLMSAGIGLSSFAGPRVAQIVIDAFGWRAGFVGLGVATLVGFPFLWIWLRERRDSADRVGAAVAETGHSRSEALRLPTFWLMIAGNLLWGLSVGGTNFLVPYLTEIGMSRSLAATYAGLFGLASLLGRVVNGFVIARLRAPYMCAGAFFVQAAALALFYYAGISGALVLILLLGVILGVQVNCFDYCTVRYFGIKSYGEIAGLMLIANGAGIAISSPLFGYLRDTSGNYGVPYFATAAMMLVPAALMFLLGRHPFHKNT